MNDEQTRDRTKIDENMMQSHIDKLDATGWYGLAEEVRIVLKIALVAGGVIKNHLAEISRLHELCLERTKSTHKILVERDKLRDEVKRLNTFIDVRAAAKEMDAIDARIDARTLEQSFLDDVATELVYAREKFPSNEHMLAALFEEAGEVANALLELNYTKGKKGDARAVWNECVQAAAMCLRVAVDGDPSFLYKPPIVFVPTGVTHGTLRASDDAPELPRAFFECGICSQYHLIGWEGDCRDDKQRFSIGDLSDDEFSNAISLEGGE